MSKSKTNLIETGILSIGIFVAGLGIQGNAKAAVNQAHSKVKYGNQKKSYTVSPRVSYFNVSNPKPQSASAVTSMSNSFQASGSVTNTIYQSTGSINSYAASASGSKDNSAKKSHKVVHHAKKENSNQVTQTQQQTSVMTKLKRKKHAKNNYDAHVHKAVANGNSSAVQSTSGSNSNVSSLSYRDAESVDNTTTQSSSSVATSDISDQSIQNLIAESKRYLGASYEYGGNGQDGSFDCSGFTQYLYQHQNVSLPRTAQQQYDSYQHVDASQAKAGDLVFFGSDDNDISHVGIYLGNGQMIDAQDQGVIIEAVNAPWWNLIGYARITN